jgi:hypothetical protein
MPVAPEEKGVDQPTEWPGGDRLHGVNLKPATEYFSPPQ